MRRDVLNSTRRPRAGDHTGAESCCASVTTLLRLRREPTLVVSDDRRVLFANPAAEELFGRSGDELRITPYALPLESGPVARLAVAGSNGAERQVELHVAKIPWSGQRASLVTLTDVSELRRLRQALRDSHADRVTRRLAAGIAHDFNNLLQSILGFCKALDRDAQDPERVREAARSISGVAERARPLVRRLLSCSRQNPPAAEVVDLAEAVRQTGAFLRRLIGTDADLTTDVRGGPLRILIDPTQLEQIILNLVLNARDAVEQGGSITLAASGSVAADGDALLVVEDSGCGMDARTQARIFEPFFSTKSPQRGTGLGLCTVRDLVHSASGRISVTSKPGVGSRFEVRFPVIATDSAGTTARTPQDHRRACREAILVVDDDAGIRETLREFLASAGYCVETAATSRAARARLRSGDVRHQLLIVDATLAGGSAGLVRAARRRNPRAGVILMSGHAEAFARRQLAGGTSVEFLPKPFTLDKLLAAVQASMVAAPQRSDLTKHEETCAAGRTE
ncbi:MAG: response regulator [Planctomycetota bacterium]|nr:MAG: response regulator [Planctomycetota bacterium]